MAREPEAHSTAAGPRWHEFRKAESTAKEAGRSNAPLRQRRQEVEKVPNEVEAKSTACSQSAAAAAGRSISSRRLGAEVWAQVEAVTSASALGEEHSASVAAAVWTGTSRFRLREAIIVRQASPPDQPWGVGVFRSVPTAGRVEGARGKGDSQLEQVRRTPGSLLGEAKPGLRIPTWLLGILVGGGLAFVAGYYFPEQQANEVLARDLKRLGGEYQQALAAYEKSHAALAAVEKVRDEQKGALGEISEQKQEAEKALSDLHQAIASPLEKFVNAEALAIEKRDDSVTISLESLYLVYPHKTFVHDRGKKLLCEIAKALPKSVGKPTQVVAHVNGDEPWSGILKKEFPSTFQLSASIAAEVTLDLAACGTPADALRAVGAGHVAGDEKLAKKSVARIEIVVYPKPPR